MRRHTVALVTLADLAGVTTPAVRVRELARSLARPAAEGGPGHRVTVYTRRQDPAARSRSRLTSGAALRLLDAGPAAPLEENAELDHVGDLADALRRAWTGAARPDVVHAHGWIAGMAACAVARELEIPFVLSYHGLAAGERRAGRPVHPARMRMEATLGKSAALVLAAHAAEAEALARMGVPRTALRVLPLGVDDERFTPEGPAAPRRGRPRLLVLPRRLDDGGAEDAIRALVHLPDAELVIAGGPEAEELGTDPAVHHLTLLAKELHVADRVEFAGAVAPRALPKLLRSARLLLNLSPTLPVPETAVAAMACGVPVVTTPAGANADSVLSGITGLHVPASRPAAVGRTLRRLLADETTLHGWSIAAVDRARSRYGWGRIAAETARAYDRVLPEPEPEPEAEPELVEALAS
ncbi:Mannosylfructose-phosphate synthase [Actinomadura rubteroloni]|uniref:Mannosylfructose-phosphate synthase n=1 Tax=Actinomadura rubteroloni TaxID=1926885 RepID=A0A2P4UED4_9ACTN|nr:glycosyltransferase [Actinomadura rubteroloni]POM23372.1 Mannosylfructose-phosphate synthase [Actinomadura rubteroloni]